MSLSSISDDDLIEVHAARTAAPTTATTTTNSRTRSNLENLLQDRSQPPLRPVMNLQLPTPSGSSRTAGIQSARSSSSRPSRAPLSRTHPNQQHQSFRRPLSRTPQQQDATIIDLTDEPDSPDGGQRQTPQDQQQQEQQQQQQQQQQSSNIGRNPRRTNSQRISPPSLSRSDSTFMGPQASFIDLTADSPEDERRSNRDSWRSASRTHTRHHFRQRSHVPADQLIHFEIINHQQNFTSELARGFGRTLAGFLNGEIMRSNYHPPDFDVRITHAREESPKPPMEPIPPTRTGFTRDTCAEADQEKLVICPACNEELAYDPMGTSLLASGSKKRKRVPGEHHFWALKKCGHVYCAECFENRRPTKTNPNGVGFPTTGERQAIHTPSDIRCVVDGCDTKVAAKTEWVGIFL